MADASDLYQRHAAAFAKARGRGLIERTWLDLFLSALGPAPEILDLGCGFGVPVGEYLLAKGCRVTGVDTAPALIEMAEQALREGQWQVGDMRGLDLGRRFDGILAWHSFFHLTAEEQRAMFPVFAAHARSGSILMFTSGPEAGEALGEFEGEELYHASLDPKEYESLLADQGFQVIDHMANDPDCGGATVWLARFKGG